MIALNVTETLLFQMDNAVNLRIMLILTTYPAKYQIVFKDLISKIINVLKIVYLKIIVTHVLRIMMIVPIAEISLFLMDNVVNL